MQKYNNFYGALSSLVFLLGCSTSTHQQIVDAYDAAKPIPLYSQIEPQATMETAYQIQKKVVYDIAQTSAISGYKAGLTSAAGQKKFNVVAPLSGVLFAKGLKKGSQRINIEHFVKPMIEAELGFVIKTAITQPITTIDELKEHLLYIVPVVELPDLGFQDLQKMKGVDIVAANVAARQYIAGDQKWTLDTDVNGIMVEIFKDQKKIFAGQGADVMNDQWQALLWLVNETLKKGYPIQPGQLLITGAIGKMLPGKSGKYRIKYSKLGQIEFTLH